LVQINQKNKTGPTDVNTTIQTLRSAVDQLDKRETHLQKKIEQTLHAAKDKSKRRDKKGALFELKKKKQLENQLQQLQGKKFNLETQISALEDAQMNKQTIAAMQVSAKALKQTVKESDIDQAENLMEDLNEVMDQVTEFNDALSQPMGQEIDDAELENELAELDDLAADDLLDPIPQTTNKSNISPNKVLDLPNVPANKIPSQNEEEKELADLEQMLN